MVVANFASGWFSLDNLFLALFILFIMGGCARQFGF